MTAPPDTDRLPAPLRQDRYRRLRVGVFDGADTEVFVNDAADFAFLDPLPLFDYAAYQPRSQRLGLADQKKQSRGLERRFAKIAHLFEAGDSFVEIGAAEGAFLELVHDRHPSKRYVSVEPDTTTRPARSALNWLGDYPDLAAAQAAGVTADIVGMFHVFEHLSDPAEVLARVRGLLNQGGLLVVEVPCLHDPLLSLYRLPAYEVFYFQRQHPYVYSGPSLARVLDHNGFEPIEQIHYQRYGLDNHLHWLRAAAPGGNARYLATFAELQDGYRQALESAGLADTVFIVARAMTP